MYGTARRKILLWIFTGTMVAASALFVTSLFVSHTARPTDAGLGGPPNSVDAGVVP